MTPEERTAAHEAGHACAAVLLCCPVRTVSVQPHGRTRGHVLFSHNQDPDGIRKAMKVLLAGPLMGAEDWCEVPAWPLRDYVAGDEADLLELARQLDLDEKGWRRIFREALELTTSREFRMLHTGITGVLDFTPTIDASTLNTCRMIIDTRTTNDD